MNDRAYAVFMKQVTPLVHIMLSCLLLGSATATGCREQGTTPVSAVQPKTQSTNPEPRKGYEIPIPSREYWGNTNTLKFEYEMRYDVDGKLKRNGWSRAYFGNGQLEREGSYTNNERVGIWNFFDREGNPGRTEDRKGIVIWTGPGQDAIIPGTEP